MKSVNEMNRDQLRAEAKALEIPGRGSMTAAQLREAVAAERRVGGSLERLTAHTSGAPFSVHAQAAIVPFSDELLSVRRSGLLTAPLTSRPAPRNRYRDRVARGELIVRTRNGAAPPARGY